MDSDDGLLTNRNVGPAHLAELATNRSPRYELAAANRSPVFSQMTSNQPIASQNLDSMSTDNSTEGNHQVTEQSHLFKLSSKLSASV